MAITYRTLVTQTLKDSQRKLRTIEGKLRATQIFLTRKPKRVNPQEFEELIKRYQKQIQELNSDLDMYRTYLEK